MPRPKVHFNCPHCDALYQVVRTEARLEIADSWVTCASCRGPIPAREDNFVFKYFFCDNQLAPIGKLGENFSGQNESEPLHSSVEAARSSPAGGRSPGSASIASATSLAGHSSERS